jgi:hypothetical protein
VSTYQDEVKLGTTSKEKMMPMFGHYFQNLAEGLRKTIHFHWSSRLILELNVAPSKQETMEGQRINYKNTSKMYTKTIPSH